MSQHPSPTKDHDRTPVPPEKAAAAHLRRAVLLVASDVVHAVRAARAQSRVQSAERPVVLVVAHPGRVHEPSQLYGNDSRLPPELSAFAGRARLALRRAGRTDNAVLAVPFVEADDAERRARRISEALLAAARRLRASELVVDELAYWEPDAPRVADRLRAAAEDGRLGGTELTVLDGPAGYVPPATSFPSPPGCAAVPGARRPADRPVGSEGRSKTLDRSSRRGSRSLAQEPPRRRASSPVPR